MSEPWDDTELLRHVFDETRVVRRPLSGIITGYHILPYIIVGPEAERPSRSVEVRGRIKVSPRLVISPGRDGPTYGETLMRPRTSTDRKSTRLNSSHTMI